MADVMQEVGGDGFMFSGLITRRGVTEVTDGLVRRSCARAQFRDNLLEF